VEPKGLDSQGLLITSEQPMKLQDGEKGRVRCRGRSWWASASPPSFHFGCCQQALGSQTIQVGHQQVEVFIVEQTVHSEQGIPMSCQFYLLSDG